MSKPFFTQSSAKVTAFGDHRVYDEAHHRHRKEDGTSLRNVRCDAHVNVQDILLRECIHVGGWCSATRVRGTSL